MISYKKLSYVEGVLLFIFGGIMCIPLIIDLSFSNVDGCCAFALGAITCIFIAGVLFFSSQKPTDFQLSFQEKVVFTVVTWLIFPIVASLPLLMSSTNVISTVDALFEITSAITSVGTSVIPDISILSAGMIFWRSFLQVVGCIFFIISNMFMFTRLSELMIPNLATSDAFVDVVKIVVALYLGISFVAALALVGNGIPSLEACCYSFSAISSGGLIPQNDNVIDNGVLSFVLLSLMFFGGMSVVFFRNIIGTSEVKDIQLRYYIGMICLATLAGVLVSKNISGQHFFDEIHRILFNVVSSITTTGINVDDNNGKFSSFTYLLNFFGGCFGSGTGGIKILRCILVFSLVRSYLAKLTDPSAVCIPTYNGQKVDISHLNSLFAYFSLYVVFVLLLSICLTISDFDFGKSFGAIITSVNGNGPYFGMIKALPTELASITSAGKIVLLLSMLAGRLEFIPFFVIITKRFWKRGK